MQYNAKNMFFSKCAQKILLIVSLLFCIVFVSQAGVPQKTLKVPVKFKIINGDLDGARVIIENAKGFREAVAAEKIMDVQLLFNESYVVTFEKPGYVTKKIEFDTKVPADRLEQGFEDYPIMVKLFKQYDEVNLVVFNQPVAKIAFSDEIDDFDYDVDYTKSIQSVLAKAEHELDIKARQEEKVNSKKAKQENRNKRRSSAKENGSDKRNSGSAVASSDNDMRSGALSASASDNGGSGLMSNLSSDQNSEQLAKSDQDGDTRPSSFVGKTGDDLRPDGQPVEFGYDERPAMNENISYKDYSIKEVRENRRTVTTLTVEGAEKSTVYKKVVWDWGGTYYFVNETTPITKDHFDVYPYMN